MADPTLEAPNAVNTSAGHLAVRVDGLHPAEHIFSFEQQQSKRMGLSLIGSFAFQFAFASFVIFLMRHAVPAAGAILPNLLSSEIVWLAEPGPGGGGGGGGNKMPEPPRKAELPGKDKITVPVEKPPVIEPLKQPKDNPPEVEQLEIPAKLLASAENTQAGMIDTGAPTSSASQGTGTGGGAGTGAGSGVGPGTGSGLGPGSGGGTGGGVYRPGNGITPPVPTYVPKPAYTAEAMRARVQGVVLVECVVQTNGQCSDTRVVRSLDPTFGLDLQAVEAAKKFRFRPGMRQGEPVAVLVTIELSFSLH